MRSLLPHCMEILDISMYHNDSRRCSIEETLLTHIPMETTEDIDDCKMYMIAIYSGNKLLLPV